MSIYGTILNIQHPDEWAADLRASGIDAGTVGDDSEERELGSPWVYRGSHILPARSDARGGAVELAEIPNHITRDGHDEGGEGLHDWLRVSVTCVETRESETDCAQPPADADVVLDRAQVVALHAALGHWLDRPDGVEPPLTDAQIAELAHLFDDEKG